MGPSIEIEGEEYVTAREAAALLGVKVDTLYAYASRGRIQSFRQGSKRRRLYRRNEIADLIAVVPSRTRVSSLPLAEDWIPFTR